MNRLSAAGIDAPTTGGRPFHTSATCTAASSSRCAACSAEATAVSCAYRRCPSPGFLVVDARTPAAFATSATYRAAWLIRGWCTTHSGISTRSCVPRANSPSASGSAPASAVRAGDRPHREFRARAPPARRAGARGERGNAAGLEERARARQRRRLVQVLGHRAPGALLEVRAVERERAVRGRRVGSGGPIGGGGGSRSCRPTRGARGDSRGGRANRDARTATREPRYAAVGTPRLDAVAIVPEVRAGCGAPSVPREALYNKKKCLFPRLAFVPVSTSGIFRSSPASLLAALVSRAAHGGSVRGDTMVFDMSWFGALRFGRAAPPAVARQPVVRASSVGRVRRRVLLVLLLRRTDRGVPASARAVPVPAVRAVSALGLDRVLDARGGVVRAPVVPAVQAGALHGSPPCVTDASKSGALFAAEGGLRPRLPRVPRAVVPRCGPASSSAARTCASSCGTGSMERGRAARRRGRGGDRVVARRGGARVGDQNSRGPRRGCASCATCASRCARSTSPCWSWSHRLAHGGERSPG